MSIVIVNAITVPADQREAFEARFAARAGQVSKSEGFEAFELLRPSERDQYLVYTRWRSREDFDAWMKSQYFAEGHRKPEGAPQASAGTASEVWSFDVLQSEYAGS